MSILLATEIGRIAAMVEQNAQSQYELHPYGGRRYDEHPRRDHHYQPEVTTVDHHHHYDQVEELFRYAYVFSESKMKFDPSADESPFFWGLLADLVHVQQKYNHVSLITLPHSRPAAPDEPEG